MIARCSDYNKQQGRLRVVVEQAVNKIRLAISWLILVWAAFFVIACQTVNDHDAQTVAYRSVWSQLYPTSVNQSPDTNTLHGRFIYAVSAQSLDVAKKLWSTFLSEWKPKNGYFEDGMHARLISWAELEMQRTRYLEISNLAAAKEVGAELRRLAKQME